MCHGHSTHFSSSDGGHSHDPLGLRMEDSQGGQREPKTYRGRTVDVAVGAVYQDLALAHAGEFNEWCNGLPDRATREKAERIYAWGFWANQCIFTSPTREYGEFMICWLIERGCPTVTLELIKFGFGYSLHKENQQ